MSLAASAPVWFETMREVATLVERGTTFLFILALGETQNPRSGAFRRSVQKKLEKVEFGFHAEVSGYMQW